MSRQGRDKGDRTKMDAKSSYYSRIALAGWLLEMHQQGSRLWDDEVRQRPTLFDWTPHVCATGIWYRTR